jgi:hypothetical protein
MFTGGIDGEMEEGLNDEGCAVLFVILSIYIKM